MVENWNVEPHNVREEYEDYGSNPNERTANNQPPQGFEGMNYEQVRKPYTNGHVKLRPATNDNGRNGDERSSN